MKFLEAVAKSVLHDCSRSAPQTIEIVFIPVSSKIHFSGQNWMALSKKKNEIVSQSGKLWNKKCLEIIGERLSENILLSEHVLKDTSFAKKKKGGGPQQNTTNSRASLDFPLARSGERHCILSMWWSKETLKVLILYPWDCTKSSGRGRVGQNTFRGGDQAENIPASVCPAATPVESGTIGHLCLGCLLSPCVVPMPWTGHHRESANTVVMASSVWLFPSTRGAVRWANLFLNLLILPVPCKM